MSAISVTLLHRIQRRFLESICFKITKDHSMLITREGGNSKRYPCTQCNKIFQYCSGLSRHRKLEHCTKQGPDLRYLRRANWRGIFFGIYGFIEPDLETHCEKIGFFGIYGFIEPDLETRQRSCNASIVIVSFSQFPRKV